MADSKLVDFIKAYQSIAPETAGINPYEVDNREDFMKMVEGMKPKTKLPTNFEDRYKFVLPEDFEYIPTDERAKYFGYSGRGGGGREFPLEGISPFQTKNGKVASDIRNSDYGSDKNKRAMLEKSYSNRDKLSMGPRYETLTEGKTPSYMLDNKSNRISNKELSKKYFTDYDGPMPMRKPKIEKAKAKTEKEKFVPKDTLLGRIFDKRIKPGEDISNSAKASAMLRNLSDNLLERRLVGGKEGTDTMSRILGPSGGIREGMTEIEALETAAQSKNLATILADQKLRRGEADIKKVAADTALQKAGINTENMDSDTKFAYYQTLAELGEGNINTPTFQKRLLENMNKQQSVEILDNIGPEYIKALDTLRVEEAGTPAHDRALKMLQLYGQYLPELEDMAETTEVQSAKELTNS